METLGDGDEFDHGLADVRVAFDVEPNVFPPTMQDSNSNT
jgi:hypothetical protein